MNRREPGEGLVSFLAPLAIIAGALVVWQIAAELDVIADALDLLPSLVPAPSDIAGSLWEDRGVLFDNAVVTFSEVVVGFALAVALGVGAALLLHASPVMRRALYPLIVASQTIPIIVIAPILVVWFGYGIAPKAAIIALICFFPIAVNTLDGLGTVDREQLRMMRTLGARRRQVLLWVEAPTALPYLLSGAKIAVAVAVIGAVFGEFAGSDSGLGHLMIIDNAQLEVPRLFAAVFVLSAMAVGLFGLLAVIERRLAWWGPRAGARIPTRLVRADPPTKEEPLDQP